jgi:hypothetical protein
MGAQNVTISPCQSDPFDYSFKFDYAMQKGQESGNDFTRSDNAVSIRKCGEICQKIEKTNLSLPWKKRIEIRRYGLATPHVGHNLD